MYSLFGNSQITIISLSAWKKKFLSARCSSKVISHVSISQFSFQSLGDIIALLDETPKQPISPHFRHVPPDPARSWPPRGQRLPQRAHRLRPARTRWGWWRTPTARARAAGLGGCGARPAGSHGRPLNSRRCWDLGRMFCLYLPRPLLPSSPFLRRLLCVCPPPEPCQAAAESNAE